MLFAYIQEAKSKDIPTNPNEPRIFVFEDVPPPIDENEIPPIKEEITQKVKNLASLEPIPTRKEIADDVILKTQDELNNINTTTSRDGDSLVASLDNGKTDIDNNKIDDRIKDIKTPLKTGPIKNLRLKKYPSV
jgi:hypothetical protein